MLDVESENGECPPKGRMKSSRMMISGTLMAFLTRLILTKISGRTVGLRVQKMGGSPA